MKKLGFALLLAVSTGASAGELEALPFVVKANKCIALQRTGCAITNLDTAYTMLDQSYQFDVLGIQQALQAANYTRAINLQGKFLTKLVNNVDRTHNATEAQIRQQFQARIAGVRDQLAAAQQQSADVAASNAQLTQQNTQLAAQIAAQANEIAARRTADFRCAVGLNYLIPELMQLVDFSWATDPHLSVSLNLLNVSPVQNASGEAYLLTRYCYRLTP